MKTVRKRKMSINSPPFGVLAIASVTSKLCPSIHFNRCLLFKISVLALTYFAYVTFHMTRKPLAVVKSVLHRNCSDVPHPNDLRFYNDDNWCEYAPFDGPDASALLGFLDTSFLFCYAVAMFFSGFIAERVSLRYFLALGMLFSGFFCYSFGYAKVKDIHSFTYFLIVQGLAGIFQTTGWPGVVTVVSRWCGKSKRGLIFGIWNSHTSIGNMLGTYIAAHYVDKDWSMSFIVPGFIMGLMGFVIFMFLTDSPELVGLQHEINQGSETPQTYRRIDESDGSDAEVENEVTVRNAEIDQESNPSLRSLRGSVNSTTAVENRENRFNERSQLLANTSTPNHNNHGESPIGFMGALKIPGVIEFSLCLFFSKLVNYTFLFWLPLYIKNTTPLSPEASAELSMVFDIGGIFGAILTGVISDMSGMSATTCVGMLAVAGPLLFVYETYGALTWMLNVGLLFILGLFVNGPYSLITTSVSAELGQHKSLEGNAKALATVTSIIDGTGSIGAAVGPLIAGLVQDGGWNNVFYMLIISNIMAMILLVRLVKKELSKCRRRRHGNIRIE